MKQLFTLILITTLLSSCALEQRFERKLRRAERKIERLTLRFPQLLAKDTLRDTFTLEIPTIRHDTAFIASQGDTVVIQKDRLSIKYVRLPGDSVFIAGECQGDTIIKRVEIPVERIVVRKQTFIETISVLLRHVGIYIVIILILAALAILALKFFKPF